MLRRQIIWFLIAGYLLSGMGAAAQLKERVYAHTDKAWYHSGEMIWFRIDVIDHYLNKPLPVSAIAYAELLDKDNRPVLQGIISLKNARGNGSLIIPDNILSGRYLFRVYTNWMKNFPAENYFQKYITVINTANPSFHTAYRNIAAKKTNASLPGIDIQAHSDKMVYSAREKITIDLRSLSDNGDPLSSSVSVSVFRVDSLQVPDNYSIADSFSGVPDGETNKAPSDYKYPPELSGLRLSGRVVDINGRPVPDVKGYISVPNDISAFHTATSDPEGNIFFDVNTLSGNKELILQTNGITADSNYHIELNSSFSSDYPVTDTVAFDVPMNYPVTLAGQRVSAEVENVYQGDKRQHFILSAPSKPFYGAVDEYYAIKDYARFSSMEDVLREYVVAVGVGVKKGKPYPFIYDDLMRRPFSGVPLLLVNAVPVFDANKFMAIEPEHLLTVEVINRKYFLGKDVYEGIVLATTSDTTTAGLLLENNAVVIDYKGVQPDREFVSPVYENEEQRKSRLPDFRNTLYWSPDIRIGNTGKKQITCYTSDLKGRFAIVVQGITEDGKAGAQTVYFDVR